MTKPTRVKSAFSAIKTGEDGDSYLHHYLYRQTYKGASRLGQPISRRGNQQMVSAQISPTRRQSHHRPKSAVRRVEVPRSGLSPRLATSIQTFFCSGLFVLDNGQP